MSYLIEYFKEYWPSLPLLYVYFYINGKISSKHKNRFKAIALLIGITGFILMVISVIPENVWPFFLLVIILNLLDMIKLCRRKIKERRQGYGSEE